jgi:hypothetical protein
MDPGYETKLLKRLHMYFNVFLTIAFLSGVGLSAKTIAVNLKSEIRTSDFGHKILYVFQAFGFINGSVGFQILDTFFIILAVFIVEHFKLAQEKFEKAIKKKSRDKIFSAIEFHQDVIGASKKFVELFGPFLCIRCIVTATVICLYSFAFLMAIIINFKLSIPDTNSLCIGGRLCRKIWNYVAIDFHLDRNSGLRLLWANKSPSRVPLLPMLCTKPRTGLI